MPKYVKADVAELKAAEYYARQILKIVRENDLGDLGDEIEVLAMIAVSTLKSEREQRGR